MNSTSPAHRSSSSETCSLQFCLRPPFPNFVCAEIRGERKSLFQISNQLSKSFICLHQLIHITPKSNILIPHTQIHTLIRTCACVSIYTYTYNSCMSSSVTVCALHFGMCGNQKHMQKKAKIFMIKHLRFS